MSRTLEKHRRRLLISAHFQNPGVKNMQDLNSRVVSLSSSLLPTFVLDLECLISPHPDVEIAKYYNDCFKFIKFEQVYAWLKERGYA